MNIDGGVNDAREEALTAEVVRSFAAADPRLKEILSALVTHLHAFIREVRLTPEEWSAGIDFLAQAGHITDDRRQEFILLSDVLGASMQTVTVNAPPQPRRHGIDRARPLLRRWLAACRKRRGHSTRRARLAMLGGARHQVGVRRPGARGAGGGVGSWG